MKQYDPVAHGAHCHVCPLKGNVVVPPAPASKRLKLVIVGEGPGRVEEKVGIPFMGSSGKFLDQLLFQQGKDFPRASIHMTNAMLCRGELENDMKTAEVCCAPRLLRELAALPKEVPIVTLGKPAAKSVLGTRSIFMARGFVWTVKPIEVEAVRAARVAYRKSTGRIVKRGPKGGVKEFKVKPGSPTTQNQGEIEVARLEVAPAPLGTNGVPHDPPGICTKGRHLAAHLAARHAAGVTGGAGREVGPEGHWALLACADGERVQTACGQVRRAGGGRH